MTYITIGGVFFYRSTMNNCIHGDSECILGSTIACSIFTFFTIENENFIKFFDVLEKKIILSVLNLFSIPQAPYVKCYMILFQCEFFIQS